MGENVAKCRGCRRELVGKPYYTGGRAYHPDTKESVPTNFYGGFVCSEQCDINVCIDMSSNMPGAGKARFLNSAESQSVNDNWS